MPQYLSNLLLTDFRGYTGSIGSGYTGSIGGLGYSGSVGYTGSIGTGYTGSSGYAGSVGYTGSVGNTGFVGSRGYTGSTGNVAVIAVEALAAGDLVNLYNNAGTINARKASANVSGKEAHGYVLSSVSASGTATVYYTGVNTSIAGMTVGTQYLSNIRLGNVSTNYPTGSGNVVQVVGVALSSTNLLFSPGPVIVIG